MTTLSRSQSNLTLCNFVNSELGKLDFESEDSLSDDDGLERDTGFNPGAKQTSEMVHNFENDDLAWYSFFT